MMHRYLKKAAQVATPKNSLDRRLFWIGCVGIRSDGTIVKSQNRSAYIPPSECSKFPPAHAENRVCKKMDFGGTLFVARVKRDGSGFAMARPCVHCMRVIKSRGVKRVYYSINNNEWGTIDFVNEQEWETKRHRDRENI